MKKPLVALVFLFVSVSAISASGDEKKSLDIAVFVKARYSEMCKSAKYDLHQAASEENKELVKLNENMTCSCLPTEFDNAMRSYRDVNAVVSYDLLLSIAKKTEALCAAVVIYLVHPEFNRNGSGKR